MERCNKHILDVISKPHNKENRQLREDALLVSDYWSPKTDALVLSENKAKSKPGTKNSEVLVTRIASQSCMFQRTLPEIESNQQQKRVRKR